jgi:archaeal flagellar protein FlaI
MEGNDFEDFQAAVYNSLEGKLSNLTTQQDVNSYISKIARSINPAATKEEIEKVVKNAGVLEPIEKFMEDDDVEDVMINNTKNIFVYQSSKGQVEVPDRLKGKDELTRLVNKLKMYSTSTSANRNIFDIHLPNGSRVNIVDSPLGADITIRNFKPRALSIIDLINAGELSFALAARFWIYAEGLKVRPANMLIGGMPAAGKTTLLNAIFSFFRPEQRIVVIEDTYELNTETQDNCVRLETNPDMPMSELVKNTLRMRPDIIIIGEVRGAEAADMMTAMNIGKICIGTIHASTARDIVTRLEHTPMNIPMDIIPLIDTMILCSQVNEENKYTRRITQVAEISGIETQVLLSDLYKFDYKTHKSSEILPSVTYRDTLAKLSGYPPSEIINEERRRAKILEKLNQLGIRDLRGINSFCKEYYEDSDKAMKKIGLQNLGTLHW